ncbi:hypothetical protein M407DRAFT_34462 [Tulasnella calospora MUT 4182]|uniref:Uncharacterized protein n=1 Tax=Tulasnella calospora MUT 4182 TaxID=1051891 RepID=A0A0C3L2H8_9AGAM|nr:hypothetical protein M407DRAFT_34462 [Tulasnella calospora MUT 4182]
MSDTLELIKDVISTFHLDLPSRPPDSLYVMLLQYGRVYGVIPYIGLYDCGWQRFFVATAIDLSSSLIQHALRSTLSQQETDQLRDHLAHCIKFFDNGPQEELDFDLASHPEDEIPRKYTEFLKLSSDALKQGVDIFDEVVWREVI